MSYLDAQDAIYTYTRDQAIQDEVLIDIPINALAREYGIRFHCAMTAGLFSEISPKTWERGLQDLKGRLWDMLTIFRLHARQGGSEIRFFFWVQPPGQRKYRQEVKAICGPGDQGEPVLTFMLPDED